ncbi:MAG TPA: F0F1 ATP synthase subunit A [Gemmatimonadales bacterium]|jgi:F-type H+-transporting ATPase subunit a|nr:F0F1 ATP synthase subunit A [Gemmatimonadales bacterium]
MMGSVRRGLIGAALASAAGLGVGLPAAAQEPTTGEAAREAVAPHAGEPARSSNPIDILAHIGDSRELELPVIGHVPLPRWEPVRIGGFSLDLSPTKHTVFMLLAALIVGFTFVLSARAIARADARGRPSTGFAGAMEATALWIRQEVILPNVGPHGEGYSPYLLTLFFFILTMNLLGLLPWSATATGNIAVTATLAVISFIVVEVSGMRALGPKGYLQTIFYLPHGLPGGPAGAFLKVVLLAVMTPIEIIGKLAKPFALAVRLFANMTAGHVLVLALIGLAFVFQSYAVGVSASILATGVMVLEVFVACLQAFVFTLLTAVFIGLIREAH